MQQREGILASGDDDLPIDEAELAPLQSNGNGEVRALDNGHAVQFPVNPEDTLRDFNNSQISPRAHVPTTCGNDYAKSSKSTTSEQHYYGSLNLCCGLSHCCRSIKILFKIHCFTTPNCDRN